MGVENPCLFVNGVISTQRLTNIHLLAIKVILHPKVLIKLQPILLDIILQELIEEWGCRFGRLALTTIDSSFIKDHRSVLVRLQHAERIHRRSEEQTSELQSLMRISYAVVSLKKKRRQTQHQLTFQSNNTNTH